METANAPCDLLRATRSRLVPVMLVSLLASAATVDAQRAVDPRVSDLVRAGKLRVALYPPQYRKNPATGEVIRNMIFMDVAQALAARLGSNSI